jgi:type 1 glutamine amidotransferase
MRTRGVKSALLVLLGIVIKLDAQHLYQVPKPIVHKSKIEAIVGPVEKSALDDSLQVLWVYGYDKHHIAGAHDYEKIKDLMVSQLQSMDKVLVTAVYEFPTQKQFDQADLVVMYLHLPQLKQKQFRMFKSYIEAGGGVVSLHETAIMRPSSKGKALSECLGFAWNEGASKWGAIFDEINIDNQHQIFKGFPPKVIINDEFYWDLFQQNGVEVLGTVRTGPDGDSDGPVPKSKLSKEKSPVFWTYHLGEGKVFGTTTGHHTFTYYDPEFRIILFRAMAWVTNNAPDLFMELVYKGITNEQCMVGIEEDMRNWQGKKRSR